MKRISSSENAWYKQIKQLATSAQARRKAGQTLLDGVHLCQSYLQYGGKPMHCIISEAALLNNEAAQLFQECQSIAIPCVVLADAQYQMLSQVEHGIGLLFVIAIPQVLPPLTFNQPAVLLDRLQDPGNLGSILRSAAAAGVKNIYCSPGCAAVWSPKVLRAAMGAHFILHIFEAVDLITLVRGSLIPVLATSSHATYNLYQADLREPLAWLFGHEGQGVAEDLLKLVERHVMIPHHGQIESLNVAAAAAICLFEQLRQATVV